MSNSKEFKFTKKQQEAYDICTDLQRKTVINIAKGNMSQRIAYLEAGGRAKTKESADQVVSKMLSMDKVKAFYDSLIEHQAGVAIMTRERALELLTIIGETKLTDIISLDSLSVKPEEEIDENALYALHEISNTEKGRKIKTYSRVDAIKKLTELEGWDAAKKHEHSGPDGAAIEIAEITDEERARRLAFLLTKGDSKK